METLLMDYLKENELINFEYCNISNIRIDGSKIKYHLFFSETGANYDREADLAYLLGFIYSKITA